MEAHLSSLDIAILSLIRRVRGIRPVRGMDYRTLSRCGNAEAIRARMRRLQEKGFLAASSMPRGEQIFRLSHKGVRFTAAPSAWANCPTMQTAAEMLSVSACAFRPEFLFLTSEESDSLFAGLTGETKQIARAGRFLLRPVRDNSVSEGATEFHLNFWLCEQRTPDQLLKRSETITQRLSQDAAFADLIQMGLFGMTIAVGTDVARTSLVSKAFPIKTSIVVVPELCDLIGIE